jgi:hypothetical protein
MAVRRTLKDKRKAIEHREQTSYQWQDKPVAAALKSSGAVKSIEKEGNAKSALVAENILGYPLSLIYTDIIKTIIFTIALIITLVALFIWWK